MAVIGHEPTVASGSYLVSPVGQIQPAAQLSASFQIPKAHWTRISKRFREMQVPAKIQGTPKTSEPSNHGQLMR